MIIPSNLAARRAVPGRRIAFGLILTLIAVFLLYTAAVAIASPFLTDDFPETLAVKVELMPVIFPIHMVTGGLALILLPIAILLRGRSRWHRLVGRIAAADVLLSGLTAFPVALVAPVTRWSAWGFSAQATVWLGLLAAGLYFIRRRRVAAHRACMILMTAITTGAVFFRVFLALWAMAGPSRQFETFYACDAWIAWLLPLSATAIILLRQPRRAGRPTRRLAL